jgi:hypothetical protein
VLDAREQHHELLAHAFQVGERTRFALALLERVLHRVAQLGELTPAGARRQAAQLGHAVRAQPQQQTVQMARDVVVDPQRE